MAAGARLCPAIAFFRVFFGAFDLPADDYLPVVAVFADGFFFAVFFPADDGLPLLLEVSTFAVVEPFSEERRRHSWDAAGHSNVSITSGYLHVVVEGQEIGNLFCGATQVGRSTNLLKRVSPKRSR